MLSKKQWGSCAYAAWLIALSVVAFLLSHALLVEGTVGRHMALLAGVMMAGVNIDCIVRLSLLFRSGRRPGRDPEKPDTS